MRKAIATSPSEDGREKEWEKALDLACVSYIHLGSPLDRCFEQFLKFRGA